MITPEEKLTVRENYINTLYTVLNTNPTYNHKEIAGVVQTLLLDELVDRIADLVSVTDRLALVMAANNNISASTEKPKTKN